MGLGGLLAKADLDALKDDKFWKGVQAAIHTAGRYFIYGCGVLSLGIIAAFTDIDPISMVQSIGVLIGLATGVETGIKLYARKKTNETNLVNHRDHGPAM